jgi:dipeptidase E
MKKIIAIGGGEIGRPGHKIETKKIDQEIIKLTGKKNPKLLFVPTASSDSEGYVSVVQNYFGKKLKCKVDDLLLLKEKISKKDIEKKILSADIVYVGGGNTLKMMNIWKKKGVDKIFKKAIKKGVVLSGLSAGAVCWFKYASSDSKKFYDPKASLIKVSGLNFISAVSCPHYDVEKDRKPELKILMKKTKGVAIALDNCCAIEIVGDNYRIINSKQAANAYKVYWKDKKYFEEKLKRDNKFRPVKELLNY